MSNEYLHGGTPLTIDLLASDEEKETSLPRRFIVGGLIICSAVIFLPNAFGLIALAADTAAFAFGAFLVMTD